MKFKQSAIILVIVGLICASGLACRATSVGSLLATATLIPSLTPTFTSAPTLTNTPVATSTPLPTGTAREEMPDGSVIFHDYDYKYSMTVPPNWMALTLDMDDLGAMMEKAGEINPQYAKLMEQFQSTMTDKTIRMMAIYTKDYEETQGTNIVIGLPPAEALSTFPVDFMTDMIAESMKTTLNATVISKTTGTNPNGIEYGFIELTQDVKNESGKTVRLYQQLIVYKNVSNYFLTLNFTVPFDQKDKFIPVFDEMLNSLIFLN
jgi:hypothetical protein